MPDKTAGGVVTTREAAAFAAARGCYVFPTRPGGKEPRAGLSWPEAATCDLSRLARAQWRPGENYGIAAKLSGYVILDLDKPKPDYVLPARWRGWADETGIKDGADVLAVIAERCGVTEWPATFTVRTPSGGMHLYYVAPRGRNIGNRPLGPMIDVRGGGEGNGGYVLGPGSMLGGREYVIIDDQDPQPLPGWVADLLDPPQQPAESRQVPVHRGSVHARLRGLVSVVLDGQQGDRNGRVFWAACRASELISAGLVEREVAETALISAALASGLRGGEPEARKTVASGMRAAA
jgi:Bifunctional DNA primase/polymerase, N-terminal